MSPLVDCVLSQVPVLFMKLLLALRIMNLLAFKSYLPIATHFVLPFAYRSSKLHIPFKAFAFHSHSMPLSFSFLSPKATEYLRVLMKLP